MEPTPDSQMPSPDQRNAAVVAHLGGLAWLVAGWFINIIIPLVIMLVNERGSFAHVQAREALNFQISILLYVVVGFVLAVATLGIGLLVVIPAALVGAGLTIVLSIVAAVRAGRGEPYRYPLTIRLVS